MSSHPRLCKPGEDVGRGAGKYAGGRACLSEGRLGGSPPAGKSCGFDQGGLYLYSLGPFASLIRARIAPLHRSRLFFWKDKRISVKRKEECECPLGYFAV